MSLKSILKVLKLNESAIKSVAMSLVMVILGIYTLNFFLKEKGQTIPAVQIGDEGYLPAIHTVTKGEDLWNISNKYYGSGYNWIDIASENDLSNPNIIAEGQQLSIPKVAPRLVLGASPTTEPEVVAQVQEIKSDEVKSNYEVLKGESLWTIAEKTYGSGYNWIDIANENKIKSPYFVEVGQKLSLPKVESRKSTIKSVSEVNKIEGDNYKVEKGDNLWEIAVRAYGDGYKWPEIAKKNNLKNPGIIIPGSTLNLPR